METAPTNKSLSFINEIVLQIIYLKFDIFQDGCFI
jgi:hypothetical protein